MPHNYSRKLMRDAALLQHWDQQEDAYFSEFSVSREQVKQAQIKLQGTIVMPGDLAYNKDRKLFNPVFDAHPSMIVYCAVEGDVAVALELSKTSRFPLALRSGGHCTAGFSAGPGVLVDVSALSDVVIDVHSMTATVGCGTKFGKLNACLEPYGLHVPGGECDDVCVGGYVQGGGYGFTSVTYGMNCDNVLAMRVMLADGSIVTATPDVNSDLWWAMRGGTGGNFGVLLNVTYQLRKIGQMFGWAIIFPLQTEQDLQNATGALMCMQSNYMRTAASPNLNIQVSLCYQPNIAGGIPVTPATPMQPYLMLRGLYVGDQAAGQASINMLCKLPGAVVQWTKMDSFQNLNQDLLNVPYGMPCLGPDQPWPREDKSARYVEREWTEGDWRGLLNLFALAPNKYTYFYMEFYGGAINAYPYEKSSFIHRNTVFNAVLDVFWLDDAQHAPAVAYLEAWLAYMEPRSNGHIYQNYPRVNQPDYGYRYWGEAQAGLYAVKCKYDPQMLFRFSQAVGPLMPPGVGPGPVIILPTPLQQALDQPIVYATRSLCHTATTPSLGL
jgi:FAD binding domain/Berberine and berberine like